MRESYGGGGEKKKKIRFFLGWERGRYVEGEEKKQKKVCFYFDRKEREREFACRLYQLIVCAHQSRWCLLGE